MKNTIVYGGSRWRPFPVGLRPPSKDLHWEKNDTNIIKQYVKEQIYRIYNLSSDGTKIRAG